MLTGTQATIQIVLQGQGVDETPHYVIDDSNNPTIGLTLGSGDPFGPTSDWEVIKVQKLGEDDYEVLLSNSGVDYDVYQFNSEGNFVSSIKTKLWEDELKFDYDIDGDTVVGLVTISGVGNAHLFRGKNTFDDPPQYQYYIKDGSDDPIGLTYNGAVVKPNSVAGWSAIQVSEKLGTHYEVLWSKSDVGANVDYDVWKVDAYGNFVSSIKAKLWEDELKFDYDINLDGDTGSVPISDVGNAHLFHGDNTFFGAPQYYIKDAENAAIGLTYNGAVVEPNSVAGWSAIQVEKLGTHYTVVWKPDASDSLPVSVIEANLWPEDELSWNYDIYGDGDTLGLETIEPSVAAYLSFGDNTLDDPPQYYIVDGSDDPIGLTYNQATNSLIGLEEVGPWSGAGWSAIQVKKLGDHYEVLWSNIHGDYDVWKVDAYGNFVSSIKANLWEDESKFGLDIDGDGYTGSVEEVFGCTNPSGQSNYNELANTDNGSCIPCVYGCMDTNAYNVDPAATCDDSSCKVCDQLKTKYNSDDCLGTCGSKSDLCEGYKTDYDTNCACSS